MIVNTDLTFANLSDILKVIYYLCGAVMKKVLISAFLPFNQKENNYSAEVQKFIKSDICDIDKVIIDVVYDKCFEEISRCGLDAYDLIVALGEARMRNVLTVERRAKNISSCSLPDNSGEVKRDEVIDPLIGEFLECALDLEKISELAEISLDAGKFVCNNLYFHLLSYDRARTLFIHVPECNNDEGKYKLYAEKISKIIEAL